MYPESMAAGARPRYEAGSPHAPDSMALPSLPESPVPTSALAPLVAPLLDAALRADPELLPSAAAEQLSLACGAASGQASGSSAGCCNARELRCRGSLPDSDCSAVPIAAAGALHIKTLGAGSWCAAGGTRAKSRLHQELSQSEVPLLLGPGSKPLANFALLRLMRFPQTL